MTEHAAVPTPRDVLATTRALAGRVRSAQRGAWFPLVVLGAVTLGAIPAARYGHRAVTCRPFGGGVVHGYVCSVYSTTSFAYWPLALSAAYAVIAWFFVRRSRARGVGTRARPYVVAGMALAVLLSAAALWAAHHPADPATALVGLHVTPGTTLSTFVGRLTTPGAAIGLALLVLARVERDLLLLAVDVVYLAVVLTPVGYGWLVAPRSVWYTSAHLVVQGALLLLGGLVVGLARRRAVVPGRRFAP